MTLRRFDQSEEYDVREHERGREATQAENIPRLNYARRHLLDIEEQ